MKNVVLCLSVFLLYCAPLNATKPTAAQILAAKKAGEKLRRQFAKTEESVEKKSNLHQQSATDPRTIVPNRHQEKSRCIIL